MTLNDFIWKYNGRYIDYDNAFGFQCYDLFLFYLKEVLDIDPKPYQGWGTAKNCYLNFPVIKNASTYFQRIANGPYNAPQRGDIVFWGTYPFITGWAGHVGICTSAGTMAFVSFDQNYGKPNFCRYVNHSYKGVMGWLHKK